MLFFKKITVVTLGLVCFFSTSTWAVIIALHGAPFAGKTVIASEVAKFDQNVCIYSFKEFSQIKDEPLEHKIITLCLSQMRLLKNEDKNKDLDELIIKLTTEEQRTLKNKSQHYWLYQKSILFWEAIAQAQASNKIVIIDDYPYSWAGPQALSLTHVFVHCRFAEFIKRVQKSNPHLLMFKALMAFASHYQFVDGEKTHHKMTMTKDDFSTAMDCVQADSLLGGPDRNVIENEIDLIHDCYDCFQKGSEAVALALNPSFLGKPYDLAVDSSAETPEKCAAKVIEQIKKSLNS